MYIVTGGSTAAAACQPVSLSMRPVCIPREVKNSTMLPAMPGSSLQTLEMCSCSKRTSSTSRAAKICVTCYLSSSQGGRTCASVQLLLHLDLQRVPSRRDGGREWLGLSPVSVC